MSAHLGETGTARDGRAIVPQEFARYRLDAGRIADVWGDLDRSRLEAAAPAAR